MCLDDPNETYNIIVVILIYTVEPLIKDTLKEDKPLQSLYIRPPKEDNMSPKCVHYWRFHCNSYYTFDVLTPGSAACGKSLVCGNYDQSLRQTYSDT